MSKKMFKARLTLINARFASKKNMQKITAVSSNLCTNVHGYGIDPTTYYERWIIKKEEKGYIFRELKHGGGISGHHKTIKACIIASCGLPHINIFYEDTAQV